MFKIGDQEFVGKPHFPDTSFDSSVWKMDVDKMTISHRDSSHWDIRLVKGVIYSKSRNSGGNRWETCRKGLQIMFKEKINEIVEKELLKG